MQTNPVTIQTGPVVPDVYGRPPPPRDSFFGILDPSGLVMETRLSFRPVVLPDSAVVKVRVPLSARSWTAELSQEDGEFRDPGMRFPKRNQRGSCGICGFLYQIQVVHLLRTHLHLTAVSILVMNGHVYSNIGILTNEHTSHVALGLMLLLLLLLPALAR